MSLDPLVELQFPVARRVTAMFASIQRPLGPGSEPMEAIDGRVDASRKTHETKPTAHERKRDLCPLHFDLWVITVIYGAYEFDLLMLKGSCSENLKYWTCAILTLSSSIIPPFLGKRCKCLTVQHSKLRTLEGSFQLHSLGPWRNGTRHFTTSTYIHPHARCVPGSPSVHVSEIIARDLKSISRCYEEV